MNTLKLHLKPHDEATTVAEALPAATGIGAVFLGSRFTCQAIVQASSGEMQLLLTHGRTVVGAFLGFRLFPDAKGGVKGVWEIFPSDQDYPVSVDSIEVVGILSPPVQAKTA